MSKRMREAVEEIQSLILGRFPEAKFDIGRFPEEHNGIEIWVEIDMDEPSEAVSDLLGDRIGDLLINEGLFILVMAVPTPERSKRLIAESWERYRQEQREKASA